jgi:outer membrane lipoprotein LolB
VTGAAADAALARAGRARTAGAVALAMLAAACTTLPQPEPLADSAPLVAGRLSLRIDATEDRAAQSFTAAFELRGSSARGELRLVSPLGTQMALARWSPSAVSLLTADGEARFPNLDDLALRAFGERVPLAALPDWLAGRPWPGAAAQPRTDGFDQLGWSVDLSRRADGRLAAQRSAPPAVTLRVVLDAPAT